MAAMLSRSSSRPPGVLTVAELLDRIHPELVPPVEPSSTISVDALLRREGRAPSRRSGPTSAAFADPRARCTAAAAGALLVTGAVVGAVMFTDARGGSDPIGTQDGAAPGPDRPTEGLLSTGDQATIVDAAASSMAPDPDVASGSGLAGLAVPAAPAARDGGENRSSAAPAGSTSTTSAGASGAAGGNSSGPSGAGSTAAGTDSSSGSTESGSTESESADSDGADSESGGTGSDSSDDSGIDDLPVGDALESATGSLDDVTDDVTDTAADIIDDASGLVATRDPVGGLPDQNTAGRTLSGLVGSSVPDDDIPIYDDPVADATDSSGKHRLTVSNDSEPEDSSDSSTRSSRPQNNSALSSLDNLDDLLQKPLAERPN